MNYDWYVFNYKVVTLLETLLMISHKMYKIKHEMIMIAKKFGIYVSPWNLSLSLEKVHCSLKKLPFSPRNYHILKEELKLPQGATMCLREQGLQLFGGTINVFLREQMCLKLCLILIFSYVFWLKCFQLQSCNSPKGLSNDRVQAYIKMNMNWFWL